MEETRLKRTKEGWISGRCGRGGRGWDNPTFLFSIISFPLSPTRTSPPHTPNEGCFSSLSLSHLSPLPPAFSGISGDQTHPRLVAVETPHTHFQQTRSVSRSRNASILPVPSISISSAPELARSGAGPRKPKATVWVNPKTSPSNSNFFYSKYSRFMAWKCTNVLSLLIVLLLQSVATDIFGSRFHLWLLFFFFCFFSCWTLLPIMKIRRAILHLHTITVAMPYSINAHGRQRQKRHGTGESLSWGVTHL